MAIGQNVPNTDNILDGGTCVFESSGNVVESLLSLLGNVI